MFLIVSYTMKLFNNNQFEYDLQFEYPLYGET